MTKKKIIENETVDTAELDTSGWPAVFLDDMSEIDKELFIRRKTV